MLMSLRGCRALFLLMVCAAAVTTSSAANCAEPQTSQTSAVSPPAIESGRLGFALLDLQTSKTYGYQADQRFPMQSVFKCILAVKVLQEVDAGKLTVDQPVVLTPEDLAMQWSPISKNFQGTSQTFTIRQLLTAAVGNSDNTAADKLMQMVGGPTAVTAMIRSAGINDIRIDRYEREFQPELLGLPAFKLGEKIDQAAFDAAASAVPPDRQKTAFQQYISSTDPRDTATPLAACEFLAKLANGHLLSRQSTSLLLKIMTESASGAKRLKAGLPPGATLAHKTGTGGDVMGANAGTNDIGIITLADGRKFAIASFLAGSAEPAQRREEVHAEVARRLLEACGALTR
jgi:beta-lactamase class A